MATETPPAADPAALASQWLALLTKTQADTQAMFTELLKQPAAGAARSLDPLNVAPAMQEAATKLMYDPARLMQANLELWQSHMALWQQAAAAMAGQPMEPVAHPEPGDRRFRHPDWDVNPFFALVKQSYLITSRWLVDTMAGVAGLDPQTARKVEFYTRQFADAFAPTNFPWTNPEVLRETADSQGQNLVRGMENFKRDLERGGGQLRITMSDPEAFELGGNIATTPGKVVFQNDLIQLLQFTPTTPSVHRMPILMIPASRPSRAT